MAVSLNDFKRDNGQVIPRFALGARTRYFYEKFDGSLVLSPLMWRSASSIVALPTAGQAQVVGMRTAAGNFAEFFQTTAQTLHPIHHATKGLVLDGDQVDNESAEYVIGGNAVNQPLCFLTGTDDSFAIRATLEITDASGSDQLVIGFRKAEPYQVPVSFLTTGDGLYTDFAGIGFAATKADPNPVSVTTDIGNAGSAIVSATGFTWADTKIHKLEMRVMGRKASFLINGVPLGGSVSKDALGASITAQATKVPTPYTFATALSLVPFIFVRQDADLLDAVYLRELEVGFMSDML